jgi:exonuclease III
VRLVTWNLNARRNVDAQVAAIAERVPDVVAFQEITARSVQRLRVALPDIGLSHTVDSFSEAPPWTAAGPRRYALLIASRVPLIAVSHAHTLVWPERLLSARLAWPTHELTIHVTHIPPGSSNKGRKVEMLEGVLAEVADSPAPCILCGDFNLPQAETPEGRIVTWAERVKVGCAPRVRARRHGIDGRRWDQAERLVMEGGPERALVDAYRTLHGYGRGDFSWYVKRGTRLIGRRFDHAFCSPGLRILQCEYLHDVRERGLSDHSALQLDFEFCAEPAS